MDVWLKRAARPFEALLGVVFIVAAVLKAYDINLFAGLVYNYRLIQDVSILGPLALALTAVELFLGIALLTGVRFGHVVLGLVLGMIGFFSGLIVYGWLVHGVTDCGCFGAVKMGPVASLIKNAVMFAMGIVAWRWLPADSPTRDRGFAVKVAAAALCTVGMSAYAYPQLYQAKPPNEAPAARATRPMPDRLFAGYSVETEAGERYDLGEGEYLVAMLSMTCEHCMASVPALNDMTLGGELPPLVALCYEPEAGSFDTFRAATQPAFPMRSLGNSFLEFAKLIGNAPPRLTLVRDGAALRSWDWEDTPPSYDEVLAEVTEHSKERAAASASE